MDYSFWQKQTVDKPLFPNIEWSKPEQRALAGKLAIIGGNSFGFSSVAESYQTALKYGVGQAKILLPDCLKKSIPSTITDVIFSTSNNSGSLSNDALNDMKTIASWSDGVLLIGDCGRNSETAVLYENFIIDYKGPLTITRDAFDLIKSNCDQLIERPETLLVLSFAQLQKLFQAVYYPKVLTFSMQLTNLVDAIHKFTITYPVNIAVFFNDTMIVAANGQVTTTEYTDAKLIWRGETATKATVYWLWNKNKTLESATASLIS